MAHVEAIRFKSLSSQLNDEEKSEVIATLMRAASDITFTTLFDYCNTLVVYHEIQQSSIDITIFSA